MIVKKKKPPKGFSAFDYWQIGNALENLGVGRPTWAPVKRPKATKKRFKKGNGKGSRA